ncbi:MAG: hypothetical protein ACT4PY_12845 [Armatimonadota bacterium]
MKRGSRPSSGRDLALHLMVNELREGSAAPGAVVIWFRDEGADYDGIGFLSARTDGPERAFATEPFGARRWHRVVYYVHDPAREEVRRLASDTSIGTEPPLVTEGRIVARQVKYMRLVRQRDVVTITLTVEKPLGEAILEMAVRPRN